MMRLELAIAWRYLRSRNGSRLLSLISVIAIGGVAVGVSALLVIIGVMSGMQRDLRDKILVASPDLRVLTFGDALQMTDWRTVLPKVRRAPGVVAAAPFVMTQAGVSAGRGYGEGAQVVGIEPEGPGVAQVTGIRGYAVDSGAFRFATSDGRQDGVVIGRRLAERLNVLPGDSIIMVGFAGAKFNPVVGALVPQLRRYEVVGLFETGMYEYDNTYIYTSIAAAQGLAGLGDAVTGIEARTRDRWAAARVADSLARTLGYPYRVADWQQQNASLFQALKLEKFGMGFILLLIVLVAAFNIVSTLTMVVTDKTREIGILKAMGLRSRSVRRIFFVQGLVIGLVGTAIGLALGVAGAVALDRYRLIRLDPSVYFIDHLPTQLDVGDTAWITLASIAIAAVATLYPALQAARLFPVEAIRHE